MLKFFLTIMNLYDGQSTTNKVPINKHHDCCLLIILIIGIIGKFMLNKKN